MIVELVLGNFNQVFFINGGVEVIENALRLVWLHIGWNKILVVYCSYYGVTAGAFIMIGDLRRWLSEFGLFGVIHYFGLYLYRSPFFVIIEEEELECALVHLCELITFEGLGIVVGIIFETVVGTNGILVLLFGYFEGVCAICDEFGIIMIVDEVMVGFGRCGEWFVVDYWGVTSDFIMFAKGVNFGYVSFGGVVIFDAIVAMFQQRVFLGGLTYFGHLFVCGSAVASINIFKEEGIVEYACALGTDVIGFEFAKIVDKHPFVGDVRGLGVFWVFELVKDCVICELLVLFNASGTDVVPMNAFAAVCKECGLWPFVHFNCIYVVPFCTIIADEVRQGFAIFDEVFDVVDGFYIGG